MDPILKKEIILDNYQNAFNRGLVDDESYIKIHSHSDSCIDEVDIMFKIEDGIIKDIRFDGEACAISTSATSIMIKKLIGKNKSEVLNILNNYENMLNERKYDEEVLGELNVYDEISKQPNRIRCASLPFDSLKKVLDRM